MRGRVFPLFFTVIIIAVGLFPTVLPYFTKPANRDYTFLEGFSDDYVGYVSYVKEGMYGRNFAVIRSAPQLLQKPTVIHILYILTGKAGVLLRLSPVAAYYVARIIFSALFILISCLFFSLLLRDKLKAALTSILAFTSGTFGVYTLSAGKWTYSTLVSLPFSSHITLRAFSRPHYELGAAVFLFLAIPVLFGEVKNGKRGFLNISSRRQLPVLFAAAFILGIIHVPFSVILGMTMVLFGTVIKFTGQADKREILKILVILGGLTAGSVLSILGTRQPPWNLVYTVSHEISLDSIRNEIIWFGPLLWIGLPGLLPALKRKKPQDLFLFIWITVQLSFFFYFYRYTGAENVRFIQSLYFIPLAYGTAVSAEILAGKGKRLKWAAIMVVLIASGVPAYINDLTGNLTQNTDYKVYSVFQFPGKTMTEAYRFLDTNTPRESVVLANYEAANNILIYSHNFVLGFRAGWEKTAADRMESDRDSFIFGNMDEGQIRDFFRKYHIDYIYAGYQEKRSDIFTRYPGLLTPVFNNTDVTIYRVV